MLQKIKKALRKISQNKDTKTLIGNFVSLAILRGFDFLIPLISLPYLVKTLGIDKFGLINFAMSLALYFGSVMQFGFGVTATREVARHRNQPQELSRIYSNTFWASFVLAFICVGVFSIIVFSVDRFSDESPLYFWTISFVVFQSLLPVWFFQGMERMKFIAYMALASKLMFLAGLFLMVNHQEHYFYVPLINSVAAFATLCAALIIIKKDFCVPMQWPNFAAVRNTLFLGRHAFVSQLAPNLYNNSTTFLLGLFGGNIVVGVFSAATKVIDAVISIGYVLSNTFLPYLSRNMAYHTRFAKLMLSVALLLTMLLVGFADLIAAILFGSQNIIVGQYIRILSVSVLFVFSMLVFGTNFLMLTGRDRIMKNISLSTSLVFFAIACALIPAFGIQGALATLLGGRFVMASASYFCYLRARNSNG